MFWGSALFPGLFSVSTFEKQVHSRLECVLASFLSLRSFVNRHLSRLECGFVFRNRYHSRLECVSCLENVTSRFSSVRPSKNLKTVPLSIRISFSKVSEPSALCKSWPLSAIMRFRPSKTAPLSTRIRFCLVFAISGLRKSSPLSTRMRFRLAKSSPLSTRMRFLLRNRRFGAFLRFDFQNKLHYAFFLGFWAFGAS